MARLTPFDNRDVLNTSLEIPNASGGLNKALAIEPAEYHHGDVIHVVLEIEIGKVRFDLIKDTDALQRVHVGKATAATIVSEDLVRESLDAQAIKLEKAEGIVRLPGMGGQDPDAPDDEDGTTYREDADGYAEPDPVTP